MPILKRASSWSGLLALCVTLFFLPSGSAWGQARDSVWVNSRSHVYHCPGTEFFGKTARGSFTTEAEALRLGIRPAGGRKCGSDMPMTGLLSQQQSGADRLAGPTGPTANTVKCVVDQITDGDTLVCEDLGRVRLIGIDSPEGDQQPFGTAATAALASWLPTGAVVRLEQDVEERDRYERHLAYVWYEGRLVNWLMVRHGWAVSYRYPPNLRYASRLDDAEKSARDESRGLWRVNGFKCRPTDHRSGHC